MGARRFISAQNQNGATMSARVRAAVVCVVLALGLGLLAARATQFYVMGILDKNYEMTGEGAVWHLARVLPPNTSQEQFSETVLGLAEAHPTIAKWTVELRTGEEVTWPPPRADATSPSQTLRSSTITSLFGRCLALFTPVFPETVAVHRHEPPIGDFTLTIRTPDFHRFSSYWFVGLLACVGVAMVTGFVSAEPHVRLVRSFTTAFKRLGQGDCQFRLPLRAGREVRDMTRSFNRMVSRLDTMRQLQEQRNRQLEFLNQTKSEFLSIVSHDLRTPLTSVKFYTELMLDGQDALSDEHRTEFLQIMNTEADRLARLIDDLLDLQRLDSGHVKWSMQETDLRNTIQETVRSFELTAAQRGVKLTLDCPSSLPSTIVDCDRMGQVLSNLLSNAVKFSPAGEEVKVRVQHSSRELRVDVKDRGPGVPRERWSTIFEKFLQLEDPNVRESSGTGLGLYIVKKIVDAHGGSVWVESEPGQGACFSVTLPAGKALKKPEVRPDAVQMKPTVLVGDPDPFIAAKVAQIVQTAGFSANQAHSGQQLLSAAQRLRPVLIITEITMPDLDGLEMIRLLKVDSDTASIPIVAHTYASDPGQVLSAGAIAHLAKPATRDQVLQYAQAYQRHEQAPRQRLTIVIAHEGKEARRRIARSVTELGHVPIEAEDPDDAAHRISSVRPDLLVYAEGLAAKDDLTVLRQLMKKSDTTHLPVILLVESIRRQHTKFADNLDAIYICPRDLSTADLSGILAEVEESRITGDGDPSSEDSDHG